MLADDQGSGNVRDYAGSKKDQRGADLVAAVRYYERRREWKR